MKIEIPDDLVDAARVSTNETRMSLEQQIEAWIRRGMAVEEALLDEATPDQIPSGPT